MYIKSSASLFHPWPLTTPHSIVFLFAIALSSSRRSRPDVTSFRVVTPEHIQFALQPLSHIPLFFPKPPYLLQLRLQVPHCLIHEQFFQSPLLNVTSFVFLEMMDVLNCTGEDGAFRLFAGPIGYNSAEFVDAFIDVATSSAFDFFLSSPTGPKSICSQDNSSRRLT